MEGPPGRVERVVVPTSPVQIYKRWLSSDRVLVFALDAPTLSYRVSLYDCAANTLTPCKEFDEHRPLARTMPVSYFGEDGQLLQREIVHLPPSTVLSPTRQRICWVSIANDLVVVDAELSDMERFAQEDDPGLCGTLLWYADEVRIANAFHSYNYKSIVEFNLYSLGTPEPEVRDVANLRSGTYAGTTLDGLAFVVNGLCGRLLAPDEQQVAAVSKVDLSADQLKAARKTVKLPVGWMYGDVCLATTARLLAWKLTRWEDSTRYQGVWITDLKGREVCPIVRIEEAALTAAGVEVDARGVWCRDLEWLPDESGVSFVSEGCILRMAVTYNPCDRSES